MIIYPAIDLRKGRCVRLRQGDPAAETVFGEDPQQMARHWAAQGAEWLHVVNLDGALAANRSQISALRRPASLRVQRPGLDAHEPVDAEFGRDLPVNLQRLREIRKAVEIPIQFGGGLRTLDDIQLALDLGADRVVLGTVAVEQPKLVAEAVERWGAERIAVGIDARDGQVATHGWQQMSTIDVVDMGHQVQAMGIRHVVFTDIARDGMLSGVNVESTVRLGDLTGLKVIASGGASGLEDIERLKAHEHFNLDGVIVGQAIYTGALDLAAAIEVGHRPLRWTSAGIVPFRFVDGKPQFLLLYNVYDEQWQFPRGSLLPAESVRQCALRELQNETGLPIVKLYEEFRVNLHYTALVRGYSIDHSLTYYLAEVGLREVRFGNEDHCEARWLSHDEAWELLTETAPEQLPALDQACAHLHGFTP